MLGVYEQHGFEAGYRRAVQDVQLSLLESAEDLIRQRFVSAAEAANLRRVVWELYEDLERRFGSNQAPTGFVEGGLGI